MEPSLASDITKAASRQTYYTIRFLVDRARVEDAYRAYAYFRWVDDILDAENEADLLERMRFLGRQRALLDRCLQGRPPLDPSRHEAMLVELLRDIGPGDVGLESYLRNMFLVMDFDVRRRGRLISEAELTEYTGWLATAVTDAMHHFIGGTLPPRDESRYFAVSGAHILHMLRDTYADLRAGYFNVPREVLERHSIGPEDVQSDAYRAWVRERVGLARQLLDAGRASFARRSCRRHRVAGLAYIARFDWLIETLQREDFRLRPRYAERRSFSTAVTMSWRMTSWMIRGDSPRPADLRTLPAGGGH